MHSMTTDIAIGLVAALHYGFLVLEMFLWTRPLGQRVFGLTPGFASQTARLAANQGLYNGFLATGLVWGWFIQAGAVDITTFFLACIIVAGSYGAVSVKPVIFWIQAVPGMIALALVLTSG